MGEHPLRGSRIPNAGGVQSSVDALPAEAGKQFLHKGGLGEGLPAETVTPPLSPEIGAVTENLPDQLLRAAFLPGAVFPGVGVMAVGAAQGAALQKHYIPQSGSVHSPPGTARNAPFITGGRRGRSGK